MESDSKNKKTSHQSKGTILDVSNVLPTFWVRCIVQAYNGCNKLILDGRYGVLFYFRLFLYLLYFAVQAFKE